MHNLLQSFVIYSPNEAACNDCAGFWSNISGWSPFEQATMFSATERDSFPLPASTGNDALYVSWQDAKTRFGEADICADRNLTTIATSPDTARSPQNPSFRTHLSPMMRSALAFEYYEVRPCIERDSQVTSFRDEGDYAAELAGLQSWGEEFRTFWTLYGVDGGTHTPIGDFVSRNSAHEVMNAILAVPAAARNAINAAMPLRRAEGSHCGHIAGKAADWLDDMINQSSNQQRI
ncbi:hypothetical protein ATER59S_00550 [Aquamicrobium terrae]